MTSCRKCKSSKCGCSNRTSNGRDGNEDNRGPRGFRGQTGPTGPCCTGPTGATGGGAGSTTDFAYASQEIDKQVAPNSDVTFNVFSSNNVQGIQLVPPSGLPLIAAFQVTRTGIYEFGFHARGVPSLNGVPTADPLMFALFADGLLLAAGTKYKGPGHAAGEMSIADGEGLVRLLAGNIVTLRNLTGPLVMGVPAGTVLLGPSDSDGAVAASMYLVLISATP